MFWLELSKDEQFLELSLKSLLYTKCSFFQTYHIFSTAVQSLNRLILGIGCLCHFAMWKSKLQSSSSIEPFYRHSYQFLSPGFKTTYTVYTMITKFPLSLFWKVSRFKEQFSRKCIGVSHALCSGTHSVIRIWHLNALAYEDPEITQLVQSFCSLNSVESVLYVFEGWTSHLNYHGRVYCWLYCQTIVFFWFVIVSVTFWTTGVLYYVN